MLNFKKKKQQDNERDSLTFKESNGFKLDIDNNDEGMQIMGAKQPKPIFSPNKLNGTNNNNHPAPTQNGSKQKEIN